MLSTCGRSVVAWGSSKYDRGESENIKDRCATTTSANRLRTTNLKAFTINSCISARWTLTTGEGLESEALAGYFGELGAFGLSIGGHCSCT